jgi:hypothetical protein
VVALASVNHIFKTFVGGAVAFVKGATTFIGKGSLSVERLFKIAITFIGKGSSAVKGRSFKTAKAVARVGVCVLSGVIAVAVAVAIG